SRTGLSRISPLWNGTMRRGRASTRDGGRRCTGSSSPPPSRRPSSEPPPSIPERQPSGLWKAAVCRGLAPLAVRNRGGAIRGRLFCRRQYAWNPLLTDDAGMGKIRPVTIPAGTPEGFRERLEMFMIRPLVNSGGARHLPRLVGEDLLVEDFPDPKEHEEPTSS